MHTPSVLLVLFKRVDTTQKVFEAIRQARPARLFLAADGPRADRTGEAEACAQARQVVAQVDWPCEVQTHFRTENVGAGRNVSEAVTWFLEACDEGIILEDDCLPHPDFFGFAAETLDRYRTDSRIMHISGSSFRQGQRFSDESYVFSRYNHGWGWATWKRAWAHLDLTMEGLDRFIIWADATGFWDSRQERKYWKRTFEQARRKEVDAWDYQWKYSLWKTGGLCLYPEKNLISNIGFGAGATNTFQDADLKGCRALEPLGSLRHPEFVGRHRAADQDNFRTMYWGTPAVRWRHRVNKLWRLLRGRG